MKNVFRHDFDYFGKGTSLLCGCRFVGGGGGGGAPSSGVNREHGSMPAIRKELYPQIGNAMAGKGYGPESLTNMRWQDMNQGFDKSFAGAKSQMTSQMGRVVDPRDTRTKTAVSQGLARDYASGKDSLNRGRRQEAEGDRRMGMGMAADAIAKEQRMTVSGAQQYNNALRTSMGNEARFGTFGSNVAGGVGSGMVDAYFANQIAGKATP